MKSYNGCRQVQGVLGESIEDLDLEIITLSSAIIRMEIQEQPCGSHHVPLDYWTRKCTTGESGTGTRGISRSVDVSKSKTMGDSRACVSIRRYFFADYGKKSLGAYRVGKCARKSGKRYEKAAELKHRKQIQGAERRIAWSNLQRR